jgi:hypothetical protein
MRKDPEAASLCIIKAVVKWLCRIGKFFHFGRARRQAFGTLLKPFYDAPMLRKVSCLLMPFRHTRGSRICLVALRRFERRPIFFLCRRQFEAGF